MYLQGAFQGPIIAIVSSLPLLSFKGYVTLLSSNKYTIKVLVKRSNQVFNANNIDTDIDLYSYLPI